MKTLQEMRELVNNGMAKLLTIEYAKENAGKAISTIYFGYEGQDGIDNFTIGCVKSEYELACENTSNFAPYKTQAEYWESYMSKDRLDETKQMYCLMADDGRNTSIRFHKGNDGVATCSDIDRFVYFVEQ